MKVGLRRTALAVAWLAAFTVTTTAAKAETSTFTATGAEQTFVAPDGVTSVHVVAVGGRGGTGSLGTAPSTTAGGFGAVATADVTVTPGQTLYIEVAGNGGSGGTSPGAAGFNGGAVGGSGSSGSGGGAGGGGGASDVRTVGRTLDGTLTSRLVVAGGGGGSGGYLSTITPGAGGAAGSAGSNGQTQGGCGGQPAKGGQPGTDVAGGAGGASALNASPGVTGVLGAGGAGASNSNGGGGGAGGGLFGGGGGGAAAYNGPQLIACAGAGGGGGSSGFGSGASATSVGVDTSGIPSVTLAFTPASAPPPAPTSDSVPPVITPPAIAPSKFRAANIGGEVGAKPVGGTVSYDLSEAAQLTLTVEKAKRKRHCGHRRHPGRAAGGHCAKYSPLPGSFSVSGNTGTNQFLYTGRLAGKSLRPGKYRLDMIATDAAGNTSALPVSARFKIVG